jgi:hypothetical protein
MMIILPLLNEITLNFLIGSSTQITYEDKQLIYQKHGLQPLYTGG